MIIPVASGKGGTGKTTIATSLARSLAELDQEISFLDCDVEAPNAHLFLQPEFQYAKIVDILIPQVDVERCTACGRCAEICQYHAIVVLGHPEYYKRFGFVLAKDLHVTCNLPAPEYALTVMEIVPGNLAGGGHVEYPEPFIALY